MNKKIKPYLLIITLIICALNTIGCGGSNSEQSIKKAFKYAFSDPAEELKDEYCIEEALYSHNWKVKSEDRSRLAELIRRLIAKEGFTGNLDISDAFYYFYYDYNKRKYISIIKAYCSYMKTGVGEVKRIIQIDCGNTRVTSSGNDFYLQTGKEWYVGLHYQDAKETFIDNNSKDAERWSGCYYNPKEIEKVTDYSQNFHQPQIRYCSDNYVVLSYNVVLKSM